MSWTDGIDPKVVEIANEKAKFYDKIRFKKEEKLKCVMEPEVIEYKGKYNVVGKYK